MFVKKKLKLYVMISSWLLNKFYIHGGRRVGVFNEIVRFLWFSILIDVIVGCLVWLMVLFTWWKRCWGFRGNIGVLWILIVVNVIVVCMVGMVDGSTYGAQGRLGVSMKYWGFMGFNRGRCNN